VILRVPCVLRDGEFFTVKQLVNPAVEALFATEPGPEVGLRERIDLVRCEIQSQKLKLCERFETITSELDSELVVGEQFVDQHFN
jgi:hypothetical protein